MSRLVLTCHDTGKRNSNAFIVSVRGIDHWGTSDVLSPTQATTGTGSCYGTALQDFVHNLDEYISTLTKFRDEIAKTSRAYHEAVEVDFAGRQVHRVLAPKNADGPHFYISER